MLGERESERKGASLVAPLCNSETERNDLACKMPQLAGAATANERQGGALRSTCNLQPATGVAINVATVQVFRRTTVDIGSGHL